MSNSPATITPENQLKQVLNSPAMKTQFMAALPKHINPDKFTRVLITAIATTPALVKADRNSLFAACLKSAQDGLLPDGKEAALVPFGDKIQYMPMFSGILKKIRNSGELLTIEAHIVYKSDKFTYRPGLDPKPIFEPDWFGDRGEPIGCYALAVTKDGGTYIEIMNKKDIEAVKASSRSSGSGPWAGAFYLEMWKKTIIRRLSKKLPMSTDLDQVFEHDNEDFEFVNSEKSEPVGTSTEKKPSVTLPEKTKKRSRLEAIVAESEPGNDDSGNDDSEKSDSEKEITVVASRQPSGSVTTQSIPI